ncbi:MAG TPA: type II toxin-antitoxin system prevent-host-death family antitoxin [Bryobacteraceae bacterium]|nr:type II toxin-antitoxin system prevent-host-death family antitoxin [Bryobacteraceae bacterium]
MVTVAAKELKNRLGRYLELVRQGRPVRITDRGKPIGFIVPLDGPPESAELDRMSRLLATGGLKLASGILRPHSRRARLKPGPSTNELLAGERR